MRHSLRFRTELTVTKCQSFFLLLPIVLGCTSIVVTPLTYEPRPAEICIKLNEKVLVRDFVDVVRAGIERHGMTSRVYTGSLPTGCDLDLKYTARRSWDFAPYLATAEIWLFKNGVRVAHGDYELIGGGGFSLYKWQGTKAKIDPMVDQLFSGE